MKTKNIIAVTLLFLASVNVQAIKISTSPDLKHFPQLRQVDLEKVPVIVRNPTEEEIEKYEMAKKEPRHPMVYYTFEYEMDVNIGIDDGIWVETNGKRIWTIRISVPNAVRISALFRELHLARGTEMYLFSPEGKYILGPYTDSDVSDRKRARQEHQARLQAKKPLFESLPFERLGVECNGTIVIQIIEPADSEPSSTLRITTLSAEIPEELAQLRAASAPCHKDVVCYPAWENQSNGVCRIRLPLGGGKFRNGSGGLVNNTKKDNTPYILTAFHVIDIDGDGDLGLDEKGVFLDLCEFHFFNKKKECDVNDTIINEGEVRIGAFFNAAYQPTDFALLKLRDTIPPAGAYFLGWNRSNSPPAQGIVIHHPRGDPMKFSRDSTALNTALTSLTSDGLIYPAANLWAAHLDEGTFEPGSSGSPLFDNNGYVTGIARSVTLATGANPCAFPRGMYSGKFDKSWTGGDTMDTRLRDWLDPQGLNTSKLDGMAAQGTGVGFYDEVTIESPESGRFSAYYNPLLPNMYVIEPCSTANFHARFVSGSTPVTYDVSYDWSIVLYRSDGTEYVYAQQIGVSPNTYGTDYTSGCYWQFPVDTLPAGWLYDPTFNIHGKVKVTVHISDGDTKSDEIDIGVVPVKNINAAVYSSTETINACSDIKLTNVQIQGTPTITFNMNGHDLTIDETFEMPLGSTFIINP